MIELILASVSIFLSGVSILIWAKTYQTVRSTVSRAVKIIGREGGLKRVENEQLRKVESAIGEFALENVMEQYPEIQVFLGWLEEKHPEIAEIIESNPQIIMALAQKYLPLVKQYLSRGQSSSIVESGAV